MDMCKDDFYDKQIRCLPINIQEIIIHTGMNDNRKQINFEHFEYQDQNYSEGK